MNRKIALLAGLLAALSLSASAADPTCEVRDVAHELVDGKILKSTTRVEKNLFPADTLEACVAAARARLDLEYERDFTLLGPHGRKRIERLPFRVVRAKYVYAEEGFRSKGTLKAEPSEK